MALPIFYIESYRGSAIVELNEETSRHIAQVLRMKKGSLLHLSDGAGHLLAASIVQDDKRKCIVKVTSKKFFEKNKRYVSIGLSLLKNANRFEWFLEKATEIGVSEIIPLKCERTEKQHFRMDRMRSIVSAAMIQSQQVWLPILHEPTTFDDVVVNAKYTTRLIAHCLENEKMSLTEFRGHDDVFILIGPEGDFTPTEIELALNHSYHAVMLGNHRLRTETAGVVAATCLCI